MDAICKIICASAEADSVNSWEIMGPLTIIFGYLLALALPIIVGVCLTLLALGFAAMLIWLIVRLKKKSKKIAINIIIASVALLLAIALTFSFVGIFNYVYPKVNVDGNTYRSGFYSGLAVHQTVHESDEIIYKGGKEFYKVEHHSFDFVHTSVYIDPQKGGTLYCKSSQWHEARDYYADISNYVAVYRMNGEDEYTEIPDFDCEKIDELNKIYDKKISTVRFDIDDHDEFEKNSFELSRQSNDGLFISWETYDWIIIEGRLYLCCAYHLGEVEQVECKPVPDELSDYVVGKLAPLLK